MAGPATTVHIPPRQLALTLEHAESFAREDFLTGPSNESALALIERWPDWPARAVLLVGPQDSGKSHLAAIWAELSGARFTAARSLASADLPAELATGALVTLLIPAYAIGVFLGFTISQTGMVVHWQRTRGADWQKKALLNGVGAVVTGVVLVIISLAKFAVGGWIIFVLVPLVAMFMTLVRRRYNLHERELAIKPDLVFDAPHRPRRIIAPFGEINRSTVRAITLGRILEGSTGELTAVRVVFDATEEVEIRNRFETLFPGVRLVTVESPYRAIVEPICHYLDEIEEEDGHLPPEQRRINVVMIPEYEGQNIHGKENWNISIGVRHKDKARQQEINAALERRKADIDKILDEYGVPHIPIVAGDDLVKKAREVNESAKVDKPL